MISGVSMRVSTISFAALVGVMSAAACAIGVTDTDPNANGDGGATAAGGNAGGTTSMTSTTSTSMSGPGGSGGAGGIVGAGGMGGMMLTCNAPEHLCDGQCEGNTPATGCYQSATCTPCPAITNGTPTCSADGMCTPQCTAPYVVSGMTCTCPTECCNNADCGGDTCDNGSCVTPCDGALCIAQCLISGQVGVCVGDTCTCVGS